MNIDTPLLPNQFGQLAQPKTERVEKWLMLIWTVTHATRCNHLTSLHFTIYLYVTDANFVTLYTRFKELADAGLRPKCHLVSNASFGRTFCNWQTKCLCTQKRCKRLKQVHKPLCNWYRKVSHSKSKIKIKLIVQIAKACKLREINEISIREKLH